MFCKNCGKEINENQAICLSCGVKKGTGSTFCENCGQTVAEGSDVCLNCGVAVKKGGAGDLAGKDKTMILILSIFLGGIGVHNFIMGEAKKGILKIVGCLCTGGLLSVVLQIIDIIKICTDKYEVDPNKFI